MRNLIQEDETHSPGDEHCGPVARPPFQLRSLPIPIRWEVTRRHPYYLTYWNTARLHIRGELAGDPVGQLLGPTARAVLFSIGVTGEPVDPAQFFEVLGEEELDRAWLSGAVHPITCRGLAGLLLGSLPKDTLQTIGSILLHGGLDDTGGRPSHLIEAFQMLQEEEKPGLNDYVDEPIVSINPAASGRQVAAAIGELLKDWKSERELSEHRDRSDKYSEYLGVWDLREGWTGSNYDPRAEKTFQEIAASLGVSPSTVSNHYRRAFELITGHGYRPGLWYRIFLWHKIDLFGFEESPVSRRRPSTSPSRVPVPESRMGVNLDVVGATTNPADTPEAQELFDLMMDIEKLVSQGKSDREILGFLNMFDNAISSWLIRYIRRREDVE